MVVVVNNGSPQALSEKLGTEVNKLISEGWHPQGGVAFAGGCAEQAMVK